MCGIIGFFTTTGFRPKEAEATLVAMRDCLVHRGPDDEGIWLDAAVGVALGHRRLSILDLSPAGHQPMVSASDRYVLVFNGEIYNHQDVRRQLDLATQTAWRGHSDTESLLAAIDLWGLERAIKETVGMFALALWDRQERVLSLARDRMGEKPLYYGWQGRTLLFGSELKAVRAHPEFCGAIDHNVLDLYFRLGYIPSPWSVYQGIRKLLPGTYVSFGLGTQGHFPQPTRYWSLRDTIIKGQMDPFRGGEAEAVDLLERQLFEALDGQRLADVPIGAFLSGGIDSSTVVALLQARSANPVKTFTIGFDDDQYNEADYAAAVANHLHCDHQELILADREAREVIPTLPEMYDEPFGDSSAIPTHLVSKLARQTVSVALSGDGGDELFGGYDRYQKAATAWSMARRLPLALRHVAMNLPTAPVIRAVEALHDMLPQGSCRLRRRSLVSRVELASRLLGCTSAVEFYRAYTSQWPQLSISGSDPAPSYGFVEDSLCANINFIERMMAEDTAAYLPDDVLTKVDRASMSVSLETRVPLLDHRVVELAWRIPFGMKVRGGSPKHLLRQVLRRHVPAAIIDRPKMGFGVPVDRWLRGPLRDWAEALIDPVRIRHDGYLNSELVQHRWEQHQSGRNNWRDSLWLVMMWQAWLHEGPK